MKKNNIWMMAAGVGTKLYVEFIGRLTFSDLLILATIPFTFSYQRIKKYYGTQVVLLCLLLMVIIQITSDIFNQSLFTDMSRGISVLIISSLWIIFFVGKLSKNLDSVIYYIFGFAIINLFVGESLFEQQLWDRSNYFKARAVPFLNAILMIFSFYLSTKGNSKVVVLIFLSFSLFCFILGARSNGLIFLLSSALLALKIIRPNLSKFYFAVYASICFFIMFWLYVIYVGLVLSNNFGGSNSIDQLNKAENAYNPVELLYYGRVGLVVAGYAIAEKPFLGHGSWAKDEGGKYSRLSAQIRGKKAIDKSIIPSHSVIAGAWLYMGFFGFLVVLYLYYYLIKLYLKIYFNRFHSSYLPLVTVLTLEMMWHFRFSPYGTLRTSFPIVISLLIVLNNDFLKNYNLKNIKSEL